jgi:chemotaxis protein methyltransferase CheR
VTEVTTDVRLDRLSEMIAGRLGLYFPPQRRRDLARGVAAAGRELGLGGPEATLNHLLGDSWNRRSVEALARHLTVGETYFFRDRGACRALSQEILPGLLSARRDNGRRLRIWSAGCASGEEPYTMAMLLDPLIGDWSRWHVSILATDMNVQALAKAATGVYSEWSLRDTPPETRAAHFREKGRGRFELSARIRDRVELAYHNLAADPFPSVTNRTNAMDLILCRNVLMYFRPELARTIAGRLHDALVTGGWLSVGACEVSHVVFPEFTAVRLGDATFYVKGERRPGASHAATVPAALEAAGPEAIAASLVPPMAAAVAAAPHAPAFPTPALVDAPAEAAAQAVPPTAEAAGPLLDLARSCANEGRLEEARGWCERAIAADKVDPARHYLLAMILQEQGDAAGAAAALRRTLFLDQGFIPAHVALGNMARAQGRGAEALRHFGNARSLLHPYGESDVLPHADGMTAGRLAEVIAGITAGVAAGDHRDGEAGAPPRGSVPRAERSR